MLRIFITDLAAYNMGCLVGEFIALPIEETELEARIKTILEKGGNIYGTVNEEYFITDYEFEDIELFKIEEFDNPYELNKKMALIEESIEPYQYKIIKVLLDNGFASSLEEAIDKIDNVIVHTDSSMASIAENYIEEVFDLNSLPPLISGHIDFDGIGRDLEIDGNFFQENSDIFEIID